jgi:hypothetical protein
MKKLDHHNNERRKKPYKKTIPIEATTPEQIVDKLNTLP